jgi:5-guanidino-2-oxopentanoate decarboxylase
VTTIAGKGVVPESDPLSLGSTLPLPAVQRWLSNCDVVLAIGTEIAETDIWGQGLSFHGRSIRVDLDPKQLAGPYPSELPIVAGAAQFAKALLACLHEDHAQASYHDGGTEARDLRASMRESGERAETKANLGRHAVLGAMRAALPAETRIYTDMTQIAYTGNTTFPVDLPRRWFHPSGYGTLGYALPAAIGGALGDPQTPTVALLGDAGLLFSVQEMATAAELALPLTVILWNNDALGQIRQNMVDRGIPPISVETRNPDFQALARSFGWQTSAPTSLAALERDLRPIGSQSGPVLVEVRERCLTPE